MKGLNGVTLSLWIIPPKGGLRSGSGQPKCRFINMELYPGSNLGEGSFKACLLLENPQEKNLLTFDNLSREVSCGDLARNYLDTICTNDSCYFLYYYCRQILY